VTNYQETRKCNLKMFAHYFRVMLSEGIYLPPSQFETNFVSMAHTKRDVAKTLEAADKTFRILSKTREN